MHVLDLWLIGVGFTLKRAGVEPVTKLRRRSIIMGILFNNGMLVYQALMLALIVLFVIIGAVVKFTSQKKDD